MGNKNKHVIIGYFADAKVATEAAQQLGKWDKAHDDIKLGGTGILTWEKGQFKTKKVGARAGGTGAKWGMILGAATGILTGGVSLIGGAVVGAVGGSVMGSLFHKNLGLTDADEERLQLYLMDGGAAVVVMADEKEVAPTKAELARLGGRVEDYEVPEETMEQVEQAAEVEPVPAEEVVPVISGLSGSLQSVQGIGAARVAALSAVGITTKQALLERGATPAGRAEIAAQTKTSEKLINGWVSAIDLSRVTGIGPQTAELLQAAGVVTVGDLAGQDAASLHEKLVAANASRKLVREVPGIAQIGKAIGTAKELPQVVTY